MKDQKIKAVAIIGVIIIVSVIGIYIFSSGFNLSGETTDMMGRSIAVPDEINKTYAMSESITVPLYMLAPDKMIAWNSNRTSSENRYLSSQYQNLPILKGGKQNADYDAIIAQNPDVVFVGHGEDKETVNKIQEKFGQIPVLDVEGDNNLTDIVPSLKFMGKVLGEENKSNELVSFYNNVSGKVKNTVSSIPESEKKKVYYAKGENGLSTFAPGSPQVQLITICGGVNVVQSPASKGGMGVSMELVSQWNPDVIITSDSQFYQNVYTNQSWQNVNAVKNKQVYLAPQSPFNWFENPPGANTIIGIPWTAKVIYPDKFSDMDLKNLTKEFYSAFYHYNLTDGEVSDILSSSGLTQF
ncbi:ABC transporter substrate-binding protein [Methanobacterium sp.]|uniref:ABC transporter substrate-binding protein n=1 Tax=Methanobacterium sp. TaxID=2164 RepID=UPI0025DB53F2|nr:ABC transporter substrate-binding protein [Methanobacterium sp.]MBI5458804.1 ABC transporter substrate-binding protein [Methanobacterium sp.]